MAPTGNIFLDSADSGGVRRWLRPTGVRGRRGVQACGGGEASSTDHGRPRTSRRPRRRGGPPGFLLPPPPRASCLLERGRAPAPAPCASCGAPPGSPGRKQTGRGETGPHGPRRAPDPVAVAIRTQGPPMAAGVAQLPPQGPNLRGPSSPTMPVGGHLAGPDPAPLSCTHTFGRAVSPRPGARLAMRTRKELRASSEPRPRAFCQTQPNSAELSRTHPNSAEPSRTQPNPVEPSRTQPNSAELSRTQPNSAKLSQTQPNPAELSRTQPTCRSRGINDGGFWLPVAQATRQAAFPGPSLTDADSECRPLVLGIHRNREPRCCGPSAGSPDSAPHPV